MDFEQAVRSRRSWKSFRADAVDDATLKRIFDLVQETPSSFNLQHTRFVLVRDAARRKLLCEAAYGQAHVGQAPVVVVVCAKLHAHEDAARGNSHAPQEVLDRLVPIIEGYYKDNPQFQRDEAVRSASLASMTLMLAAESIGFATCPMIGFDAAKVSTLVGLDDGHIPVMLICIGKAGDEEPFPTSRFPLEETVRFETLDGEGLA